MEDKVRELPAIATYLVKLPDNATCTITLHGNHVFSVKTKAEDVESTATVTGLVGVKALEAWLHEHGFDDVYQLFELHLRQEDTRLPAHRPCGSTLSWDYEQDEGQDLPLKQRTMWCAFCEDVAEVKDMVLRRRPA